MVSRGPSTTAERPQRIQLPFELLDWAPRVSRQSTQLTRSMSWGPGVDKLCANGQDDETLGAACASLLRLNLLVGAFSAHFSASSKTNRFSQAVKLLPTEDLCTEQTCPLMTAGPYTFAWADGDKIKACRISIFGICAEHRPVSHASMTFAQERAVLAAGAPCKGEALLSRFRV